MVKLSGNSENETERQYSIKASDNHKYHSHALYNAWHSNHLFTQPLTQKAWENMKKPSHKIYDFDDFYSQRLVKCGAIDNNIYYYRSGNKRYNNKNKEKEK